jgi:phosphoribosylglycinamide formyltransferase 1
MPTIAAPAPAARAIQGASVGFVNGGGFKAARSEPAATNVPATIAAARATDGRRPNANQTPRPITAAQAASIDQRSSNAHAPANPEPVLKRVQGNSVVSAAAASNAPVIRSAGDLSRRHGRGGFDTGMSLPKTSERHSPPNTRPLTGTAHSTQSGRPQTSHVPTVSREGCVAHRSAPFIVRSSVGIVRSLRRRSSVLGRVIASDPMEARIAVLVSGSGTNLQTLLDDPVIRPHISLVVSDRPGVRSLERAHDAGVEGAVIDPKDFPDRSDFDLAVLALLEDHRIDTLVSAGYMRLLGKGVLEVYEGRWLNIHPALLPSFPGMHGVRDALAYGVKITGVTVFLVDEGVDTGAIVAQEVVDVLPDDDWDSLEARIHAAEHRQLPVAVRALIEGRIHVEGRQVRVGEATGD